MLTLRVLTTEEVLAGKIRPTELLTEDEISRARAFHYEQDRLDYIAAHILVRCTVADLVGVGIRDVGVSQFCPTCGESGHGPPRVSGWEFPPVQVSWSHAKGWVGAVAALDRVGIDVERRMRSNLAPAIMPDVLSFGELAHVRSAADPTESFLQWWTRKEALVKVGAITIDEFRYIDLSRKLDRWRAWRLHTWSDPRREVVISLAVADQCDEHVSTSLPGRGQTVVATPR